MDYSRENNEKNKSLRNARIKKLKNKIGVIIFRSSIAAVLIFGFWICFVVIGAYIGILEKSPELAEIMIPTNERYTTIIYNERGEEIDRLDSGENREFVSLEEIPKYLQHAFIAIEDKRFYQHDGVDVTRFLGAVKVALTTPNSTHGASTITQQLIKNKLKILRNSFVTKIQEQHLALRYEENMIQAYGGSKEAAKDKILELYLNSIGLGNGQVGVQAAAMRYFDKDVSELTLAESAVIAAITQRPTYYDPIRNPTNNQRRQTTILDEMLDQGFISQQEHYIALNEEVYSRINANQQRIDSESSYHSYFTDQLISEVKKAFEDRLAYTSSEASNAVYSGLKIIATIDTRMQEIVDEAFLDESLFPDEYAIEVQIQISVRNRTTGQLTHYPLQKKVVNNDAEANAYIEEVYDEVLGVDDEIEAERIFKIPQPQAGMCIIDYNNGKVLAIAGGRGEKQTNRGWNRATSAKRQPGSVFKILASFAPALDMGRITAATVIDDVPFTVGNYTPNNWYSGPSYRGLSTIRDGVRDSMNILTVKNMHNTGVDSSFNYLLNFGLSVVEEDRNLSTALGGITYGVSQEEIAAAYGAIANGGIYHEPIYFTQVLDQNNNVILENIVEGRPVLKETTAYILTDMMKDVITSGTGGAAAFSNVKMPIAGKTGTTSEDKDLVFAGYTPYYVASIYLGYDTPRSMHRDTRRYHMQIWSHIMEQIHEGLDYVDFRVPEGIVRADICTESGKLAVEGLCTNDPRGSTIRRNEFFSAGTQPFEECDVHVAVDRVDTSTGYIANEFCPSESIRRVIGIVRPEPYEGDAVIGDRQYELSYALRNRLVCTEHYYVAPIETEPIDPEPNEDEIIHENNENNNENNENEEGNEEFVDAVNPDDNEPIIDDHVPTATQEPPIINEPDMPNNNHQEADNSIVVPNNETPSTDAPSETNSHEAEQTTVPTPTQSPSDVVTPVPDDNKPTIIDE